MLEPEVSLVGLRVVYGDGTTGVDALGPVDLQIGRGEFVSIVGPSGCGKSTLARVLVGLAEPSAGRVELAAQARGSASPSAIVFQDHAIFPWKTVLENIAFGLVVSGVPRDEADARARAWVRRMGLSGFEDAYPSALSGGMQQRVGVARALAVEPDLLVMDEPFGSLDALLRDILIEELVGLHEELRCTVVFITHSLEEALVLSDRVIVLSARPGRILADRAVPFARPRSLDVRDEPEFGHLRQDLWHILRSQVSGAPAGWSDERAVG
jgi:NitT/TauT family transport system ATP-binding protein